MSKLSRKFLKLFGSTGPTSDFSEYSSLAVAAPVETKDIDTIQSLAGWLTGLRACLLTQKAPPLQDMNSIFYVIAYELCYGFQEGIPEWNTDTVYYIGSIVKKTGTFELYGSLTDSNSAHALPTQVSDSNWQFLGNLGSLVPALSTAGAGGGQLTTSSTSFVAVGNTSVTITPTSLSQKILLIFNATALINGSDGHLTIYNNGTNLAGSTNDFLAFSDPNVTVPMSLAYVHAPNSLSPQQYELRGRIGNGASQLIVGTSGSVLNAFAIPLGG